MKKRYLSIAAIALLLNGCGDSSSSTSTNSSSYTDVTVERGPVIDSTVKDADGNIAIAQNGTNVYRFSTDSIKYPITATGGWIDIDGDGIKDSEDVLSDIALKSYSVNVTPITTFIADENTTKREELLEKIAETHGVSKDELLKLPSKGTPEMAALTNSVYIYAQQNNGFDTQSNYNDYVTNTNSAKTVNINNLYNSYKSMTENSNGMTNGVFDPVQLEKTIMNQNSNYFTKATNDSSSDNSSSDNNPTQKANITIPAGKDVAIAINISDALKDGLLKYSKDIIEGWGYFEGEVTCADLGYTDSLPEGKKGLGDDGVFYDSGMIINYTNINDSTSCGIADFTNATDETTRGNVNFYYYYDRKNLD